MTTLADASPWPKMRPEMQSKQAWRAQMRARLALCTPSECAEAGARIAAALAPALDALAAGSTAPCVALFASLPGEVDTRPIDRALRARGIARAIPGGSSAPHGTGAAPAFYRVRDALPLDAGVRDARGLAAPAARERALDLQECAWVLVPGLAFDDAGGRLGRGGGYYDRALAPLHGFPERPRLWAVAHDWQVIPTVPMDPWDVRLDGVYTPTAYRPTADTPQAD